MLIACPACVTTNRVPDARLGDEPVCGRCGRILLSDQPIELNDDNFDHMVRRTELPLVVDVWAAWCGPCLQMGPQFARAATLLKGRALFAKVNADENPRTAGRLAIRSLPTMVLLRGGDEVKRVSGALRTAQIVGWVGETPVRAP